MKPGRELDALVARDVMVCNYTWEDREDPYSEPFCLCEGYPHNRDSFSGHRSEALKEYSTDIAAAWELVEYFIRQKHGVSLQSTISRWSCRIAGQGYARTGHADTASHAICLAALKAVGWKGGK